MSDKLVLQHELVNQAISFHLELTHMKRVFFGIATATILTGLLAVSSAETESIDVLTDTVRNNCGTLNCGAVEGGGMIVYDAADGHRPYVFRVWTSPNECLRIDVLDVTQGGCDAPCANLDMYIDCTGGATSRVIHATHPIKVFDDSGFPARGWCTVSVTEVTSANPQRRVVDVLYGRYTEDNSPNCN